jgi:hypothetical protein
MERNLLLIALRRANYAHLRTLRARRQQLEAAWVDGWVEVLTQAPALLAVSKRARARAAYDAHFAHLPDAAGVAHSFERACLAGPRDSLPKPARDVTDGYGRSAEYYVWLCAMVTKRSCREQFAPNGLAGGVPRDGTLFE